ncbi:MAG: hypothetical protein AAF830_12980 [Pseudomonadota bacterium]
MTACLSVLSCGAAPEAWPIEVAWCTKGEAVRTMLIKPTGDWGLSSWDKGCEADHRVSLEKLLSEGKAPLDACLILNAALGGSEVLSAAPETDSLWLFKLYRSAKVEPNYRLVAANAGLPSDLPRATDKVEALRQALGFAQSA